MMECIELIFAYLFDNLYFYKKNKSNGATGRNQYHQRHHPERDET